MKSACHLIALIAIASLMGCAYKKPAYQSQDLTKETWQNDVQMTPDSWVSGADSWFMTGNPNSIEVQDSRAPYSEAMTTMMVKVPDTFTSIKAEGSFEVQIFGGCDHNKVFVYGPHAQVREVEISATKDTLYIRPSENAQTNQTKVIVRIGVVNLKQLIQTGPGLIEARNVRSDGLRIVSNGSGNVYLSGMVNLHHVLSLGKGSINVFGAYSPYLDIKTEGKGCVNISGNLGVHEITHHGRGDINLIGVNSRELKIYGDGRGKIGLNGRFNVNTITTKDSVAVLGYAVQGGCLTVDAEDSSRVGLAGYVNNLTVNTANNSRFQGRRLLAYDAYVSAKHSSHINVAARNKLFATAADNSSIYYYGKPAILSQFVSGNAVIVPIWDNMRSMGVSKR